MNTSDLKIRRLVVEHLTTKSLIWDDLTLTIEQQQLKCSPWVPLDWKAAQRAIRFYCSLCWSQLSWKCLCQLINCFLNPFTSKLIYNQYLSCDQTCYVICKIYPGCNCLFQLPGFLYAANKWTWNECFCFSTWPLWPFRNSPLDVNGWLRLWAAHLCDNI